MCEIVFVRDKYYSLTDIQKVFKISRSKLQIIIDLNNPPVIENKINYGNYYSITAKYYVKEDIENLLK